VTPQGEDQYHNVEGMDEQAVVSTSTVFPDGQWWQFADGTMGFVPHQDVISMLSIAALSLPVRIISFASTEIIF
jgi:hypothetical protein